MKFKVNQKDLSKAISIVQKAVATKNTMEILKGIYFEMVSVHQTPLSNAESHQAVKIAPLKSSYINQIIYHVFDVPYSNPLIRLSLPI